MDFPEIFERVINGGMCPRCAMPAVGVELRGVYDGICYWRCEKCRVKWHRFDKGDYRRGLVAKAWEEAKQ